ncbi:metal ABC transporter substrate-binding protein [Heliophilum fasciatum]|uniref:Zinc transport system substrate-binding protein n=1 Tax=Heliophilum fasciatum TaxID=35700 RepID=A0A4R2RXS0_9FIRM|nr:metal ABC transporter substrate-binding protein [Heliophilum fasciatum]MCW2278292.1 zinc transport system substrate-binding protein [Heliophilum fasciatum]TCP63915.1 zinc transport system substrate-binding protein [Heliophilum fasciatum]
MNGFKRLMVFGTSLLTLIWLAGCSPAGSEKATALPASSKLPVVASFYPMYEFTREVGGEHVDVTNIVPPGSEPHDWEPTAKDLERIAQAKVVVYNGAGFEGWIDKVTKAANGQNQILVEASKGLPLLPASEQDNHHDDLDGKVTDKQPAHTGGVDPHVWTSLRMAKLQVENIKNGLIAADPNHKDDYEKNAQAYIGKLDELDQEFQQALAQAKTKQLITTHQTFAYLARDYGLTQVGIMGISPDAEPTPKTMAEVVRFAKENQVGYIFFETLASPKVAEVIARETGAATLVLNPLEGLTEEQMQAIDYQDYLWLQRENLANLQKALVQ